MVFPKAPSGLLMELLSEPLAIEAEHPSFSWIVNDERNGEYQSAYQIIVFADSAQTEKESMLWDSGKIASSNSTNVSYEGEPLQPESVYGWKVRTWDSQDQPSDYSETQTFTTAVKGNWKADSIWLKDPDDPDFVLLRKSFETQDKRITHAYAHVSALSPDEAAQYVFKLSINGQQVGTGPERSFHQVTRYTTFDVKEFLAQGQENVIGSLNYTTSDKRFIFQMNIFYEDGSTQQVVSDSTWEGRDASDVYVDGGNSGNDMYFYAPRENINAVHYPFGWDEPHFSLDHTWKKVSVKERISNLLASSTRNTERHEIFPVTIIEKANNHYFIDFGKEIIGSLRLSVDNNTSAEKEISLQYGEELEAESTVAAMRTDNTYQEDWTLRKGSQVLEQWGYRAFRYLEVRNFPVPMEKDHFTMIALHHPFNDHASYFHSSDKVLNDVWDLVKYSIKATALDVYVDTHTRERRNYEGDAYINQLSHYSMDREYAFARYSMEYLYYRPTWPTEYKQQSIMMAWEDYMYTGNNESLLQYYDILKTKALSNYLNDHYLIEKEKKNDLVDWPKSQLDGYQFSSINTVINAFNYIAFNYLSKIAKVLQKKEDEAKFAHYANRLRDSANQFLFDQKEGKFRDGLNIDHYSLHASAFSLAADMVAEEHIKQVSDYVASREMAVSVYGSQFLLDALYTTEKGQKALELMTSTDTNSWGHLIYDLDATIATEAWDPAQKDNMSFSHAWATAPANMIPRGLFGIKPLLPAFDKFQIKPQPGNLEWGELRLPCIKGTIHASFNQTENQFSLRVQVPANTKAKVYLPRGTKHHNEVYINNKKAEGVLENNWIIIDNLPSGSYDLNI